MFFVSFELLSLNCNWLGELIECSSWWLIRWWHEWSSLSFCDLLIVVDHALIKCFVSNQRNFMNCLVCEQEVLVLSDRGVMWNTKHLFINLLLRISSCLSVAIIRDSSERMSYRMILPTLKNYVERFSFLLVSSDEMTSLAVCLRLELEVEVWLLINFTRSWIDFKPENNHLTWLFVACTNTGEK